MTAKEFLDNYFKDNIPSEFNGNVWDDKMISAMNEFTLHVSEEAIEEEKKNWGSPENIRSVEKIGSNILSRIKELTQ